MIRTQIQLSEADHAALREAAHRGNRSMADCVREAIGIYLARSRPAHELEAVAGKFEPTPAAGINDHDRWWAEAIAAKRTP